MRERKKTKKKTHAHRKLLQTLRYYHHERYSPGKIAEDGSITAIALQNYRYLIPEFQTYYCCMQYEDMNFRGRRRARRLVQMHRQHAGWVHVENFEKYLLRDEDRIARIKSLFRSQSELNKSLSDLKEREGKTKKTHRKMNRFQDRLRKVSDDIESMYFSMSKKLKPAHAPSSKMTDKRTAQGM